MRGRFNLDRSLIKNTLLEKGDLHVKQVGRWKHCTLETKKGFYKFRLRYERDGTTTIKGDDKLVNYLLDKCEIDSELNVCDNIRYSESQFRDLIDYLRTLGKVTYNRTDTYILCHITSRYKDKLTIKYFRTDTMLLQGKPLFLYARAIKYINNPRRGISWDALPFAPPSMCK